MKKIELKSGDFALVDDDDYEFLTQRKWYLSRAGYAIAGEERKKMHRLILGAKPGELVDHIDRNKLNNQRSNLRIVDMEGNVHNQQKRTGTANKYKGTSYVPRLGLWQSRCRIRGNDFFLGYFSSEEAAAYAYNKKAIEYSDTILLNAIDLPIETLEEMLITHRRTQPICEKTSSHTGVYWHKKGGSAKQGCWLAVIRIGGVKKQIGRFDDEMKAAAAVKGAIVAIKHVGLEESLSKPYRLAI